MSATTVSGSAGDSPILPASDAARLQQDKKQPDGLAALAQHNTIASGPPLFNRTIVIHPETGERCYELTALDAPEVLGYAFSPRKKWLILTSIFAVQCSMNMNASIYGNAIPGLKERFDVDDELVRIGQMVFLVLYAFGCELWAPWSEELGRKWVLQSSLFLVNIWQIGCGLAPNFASVIVFRGLGGLSSAGGSVTLGMVADLWEPDRHQYALAYVVLASVSGSLLGPIFGCFITTYTQWQWVFWTSLIFGGVVQAIHFIWVPETRPEVLLDREAQRLREVMKAEGNNPPLPYGPYEIRGSFRQRISLKEVCKITARPFIFLVMEPIVTALSLLSGFSDMLIFLGLDSFPLILGLWDFSIIAVGQSFWVLGMGHVIAYLAALYTFRDDLRALKDDPLNFSPERRLRLLLWLVPLMPIGLFILGWTGLGPANHVHYIGPLFAVLLIGIANFAIYMHTIDYVVAAYGPYAASATGGNGFARDFLAGMAALFARPLYTRIRSGTKWELVLPSIILSCVGLALVFPVYLCYQFGYKLRKHSRVAMEQEQKREEIREEKASRAATRNASAVAGRLQSRRQSAEIEKEPETPTTRAASSDFQSPVEEHEMNCLPVPVPDHRL